MVKKTDLIKILFASLFFIISGCGMKGPPAAPGIVKPVKVSSMEIVQEKDDIRVFWRYTDDADIFRLDLAHIECAACPANFNKLGHAEGEKRYYIFSGYKKGIYKLKITAIKNRVKSDPFIKDFEIE